MTRCRSVKPRESSTRDRSASAGQPLVVSIDEPQAKPDAEVVLTELATDEDLFNDPTLDIASVAPGEEREIVIPVELGQTDGVAKRFKLRVRLRLDPLD